MWSCGARVLSVDSTFFTASKACISVFRPPYVESVEPQCAPFVKPTQLVLKGVRFGSSAAEVTDIFVGDFKCTAVEWKSDKEIRCVSPKLTSAELKSLGFQNINSQGLQFTQCVLEIKLCAGFVHVDVCIRTTTGLGSSFPLFGLYQGKPACILLDHCFVRGESTCAFQWFRTQKASEQAATRQSSRRCSHSLQRLSPDDGVTSHT